MSKSTYIPDGWSVIKLTFKEDRESLYRIFGCWHGDFTTGDKWKLSSGFTDLEKISLENDILTIQQSSGSVYELPSTRQDSISLYCRGVLNALIDDMSSRQGLVTSVSVCNVDLSSVDTIKKSLISNE